MNNLNISLNIADPELGALISKEKTRQEHHIELIASENYAPLAVMQAQGSVLTNKYAEGYPGKRYYGGCEFVDEVESLAISRAMQLYGAQAANVQPNSGSQANQAVFFSLLNPGDTILGLALDQGGHLTHGMKLNMSGKWFNAISYGLDSKELIDYEDVRKKAHAYKPKLIIAGGSAYSRIIDFKLFRQIADEIGAYLLTDMAHYSGLIAAQEYPNPMEHSHVVTSTTHKTLRGPRGGIILMNKELELPINKAVFPGIQGGPLMHIIAAKAVCFKLAAQPQFKQYQQLVKKYAKQMAQIFKEKGFRIVSGGTDCHLFLVDVAAQGLTGHEAETLLGSVGITVNKNSIPNDPNPPLKTSGIRIGTPALVSRGFEAEDVELLGHIMTDFLKGTISATTAHNFVKTVGAKYPVYA